MAQYPDLSDFDDLVRLLAGVLGLVLAIVSGIAIVYARGWDQRGRFAAFLGFAAITLGAQLDGFGKGATWRTYASSPLAVLAIVTTVVFVVHAMRESRDRDR